MGHQVPPCASRLISFFYLACNKHQWPLLLQSQKLQPNLVIERHVARNIVPGTTHWARIIWPIVKQLDHPSILLGHTQWPPISHGGCTNKEILITKLTLFKSTLVYAPFFCLLPALALNEHLFRPLGLISIQRRNRTYLCSEMHFGNNAP